MILGDSRPPSFSRILRAFSGRYGRRGARRPFRGRSLDAARKRAVALWPSAVRSAGSAKRVAKSCAPSRRMSRRATATYLATVVTTGLGRFWPHRRRLPYHVSPVSSRSARTKQKDLQRRRNDQRCSQAASGNDRHLHYPLSAQARQAGSSAATAGRRRARPCAARRSRSLPPAATGFVTMLTPDLYGPTPGDGHRRWRGLDERPYLSWSPALSHVTSRGLSSSCRRQPSGE